MPELNNHSKPVLAAIDVGSNTVRLLVATVADNGSYQILGQAQETTRLGEGVVKHGSLSKAAMDRTSNALQQFKEKARQLGADRIVALATGAARRATNAQDFVHKVTTETGIELTIVPATEEARLTLAGVVPGLKLSDKDIFLIDIGGWSTEFILSHGMMIKDSLSRDLGAVSLTERFLIHDPVSELEWQQMMHYLQQELTTLKLAPHASLAVGSGGTITTLAAVEQGLTRYDPNKINNYCLTINEVTKQLNIFRHQTKAERIKTPGLQAERADIIVAGSSLLLAIMGKLQLAQLVVSAACFREGIVATFLG